VLTRWEKTLPTGAELAGTQKRRLMRGCSYGYSQGRVYLNNAAMYSYWVERFTIYDCSHEAYFLISARIFTTLSRGMAKASRPRPKFWSRGQFDLEDLTSLYVYSHWCLHNFPLGLHCTQRHIKTEVTWLDRYIVLKLSSQAHGLSLFFFKNPKDIVVKNQQIYTLKTSSWIRYGRRRLNRWWLIM